jgi:2-keto-4-pentenoate hydratase/2-oxohepta-3-ene-1,7-dioic acid hydratase in catechol pathway
MEIMRFISTDGQARWGKPAQDGQALPLVGDLFGEYRFADRPMPVVARLAPVEPPNILAIGRNYREHAREMKAQGEAAEPIVFLKATTSVIGPDEMIILPASAPDEVDYEAELAVVIGRRARNIKENQVFDHILGYTCANDISARDCQHRRDKQWARGKSFDTFCPLGPVLVTRDSIDPANTAIHCTLNGNTMQDGNTSEMIFSISALVSYLSHQFTLLPGTVILTGTPSGVGAARTPPVFLKSDDEIRVEIRGIGELVNRVTGPQL